MLSIWLCPKLCRLVKGKALCSFTPLQNDNILDWSNFKASVGNKSKVTQIMEVVSERTKHCWKRRK